MQSGTSAIVTQIRATTDSISLGSAGSLEAISNYWSIRSKNPEGLSVDSSIIAAMQRSRAALQTGIEPEAFRQLG